MILQILFVCYRAEDGPTCIVIEPLDEDSSRSRFTWLLNMDVKVNLLMCAVLQNKYRLEVYKTIRFTSESKWEWIYTFVPVLKRVYREKRAYSCSMCSLLWYRGIRTKRWREEQNLILKLFMSSAGWYTTMPHLTHTF